MNVVHFSEEEDFEPEAEESVPGYLGVWFYQEPEDWETFEKLWAGWAYRNPYFFEIDNQYVSLEQEFDGYKDEYFVEANHLDKLEPLEPRDFVAEKLY